MTKKNINLLTKSEHQVMLYLWNLPKGGFTNQILSQFPESDKPAYTTLATFLKILVNKGYVKAKKEKETSMLYYTAKVSKETYCTIMMEKYRKEYFDDDPVTFIKFVAANNELAPEQKKEIIEALS